MAEAEYTKGSGSTGSAVESVVDGATPPVAVLYYPVVAVIDLEVSGPASPFINGDCSFCDCCSV